MSLEADPAWVSDPAGLTTAGTGPSTGERRSSTAPLYRWLRAVLPWSGSNTAETPLDRLVRTHRGAHPRPDVALLNHAFAVADRLHDGQVRRSGEKYISHPLAVAQILAELGMDPVTLAAALLHDTVEDTDYTLEQLRADFGPEVALLVDGVTKLDKVFFGDAAEAETIRKMILAAGQDVRVLIIKLADRVHNMRTLRHKSRTSQLRTANATQDVLVPLADRLGIHVLKRELEDLVLRTLDPDTYLEIDKYMQDRAVEDSSHLSEAISTVGKALRRDRVDAEVVPRPRHHSSIYQDMVGGAELHEPNDPPRMVIIVDGPPTDCYAALGTVHSLWRPVPGRFKDFIASSKFNLYQSLHTTVLGPGREPLEVMIRTEEMNDTAEYGIIVALRNGGSTSSGGGEELDWLQALLAWQGDAIAPAEFLDSLRCDLAENQVQVFTTDGNRLMLPSGATAVDLAYTLDTRVGDRLIGAYVNGRLARLSAELEDGDVVEIITARANDYPGPSREWLGFAKSANARLKIGQFFSRRGDVDGESGNGADTSTGALGDRIDAGRFAVARALRRYERSLAVDDPLLVVARDLGFPDLDALFVAVSSGKVSADDVVSRLIASVDTAQ
jgi:guanosine-3',5'-bis(diphosphate) 3'-pyrophosphohydrolase